MKKRLSLLILCSWAILHQSYAQTVVSDSSATPQQALEQTQAPGTLNAKGITVKAGDSIAIQALVHIERPQKGKFWKSLAKAIIPGFLVKKSVEKAVPGAEKSSLPFVGAGIAVVPGAVELVTTGKPDEVASVGIAAYDKDGALLESKSVLSSKKARKDWEEISIAYKASQDGVIDLSLKSNSPFTKVLNGGIFYQTNTQIKAPEANLLSECYDVYLDTYIDGQLVSHQFQYHYCEPGIPEGTGGSGGGGGSAGGNGGAGGSPFIDECPAKCNGATKVLIAARNTAQTLFWTTLLTGCGLNAAEWGLKVNSVVGPQLGALTAVFVFWGAVW